MPSCCLQFSEESTDSTTELLEDAIIELQSEGKQADLSAILEQVKPPRRSPSKTYLDHAASIKRQDDSVSPVRVTISRQVQLLTAYKT